MENIDFEIQKKRKYFQKVFYTRESGENFFRKKTFSKRS